MRNILPRHYAYFFLVFILLLIVTALSSCNLTKKINKAKTTEEKINNLITAFSATTTERIDTTVSINTASVSGTKTLDNMLRGDSIFEDTPELTITTRIYNGRIFTKAIRKAVFVPVKLDRTVTTNSISVDKGSVKTSSVSTVKNVERKPSWFNWLCLLLLLIPVAIWKYRSKIWKWIFG